MSRSLQHQANASAAWTSFVKASVACGGADGAWRPVCPVAQQVWGKPQPGGAWALLFLNAAQNASMRMSVSLSADLGLPPSSVRVRDLWSRKDVGSLGSGVDSFSPEAAVPPHDSAFFLLTPTNRSQAPRPLVAERNLVKSDDDSAIARGCLEGTRCVDITQPPFSAVGNGLRDTTAPRENNLVAANRVVSPMSIEHGSTRHYGCKSDDSGWATEARSANGSRAPAARSKPPVIVQIIADDLGRWDVGWRNPSMLTPNLDSLVSEGVELLDYYTCKLAMLSRFSCCPSR